MPATAPAESCREGWATVTVVSIGGDVGIPTMTVRIKNIREKYLYIS